MSFYSSQRQTSKSNSSEFRLMSDVVFVPVEDGTSRLLDMSGSFYALSTTATEMLCKVLEQGVEETLSTLASKYAVDGNQLQVDLNRLLHDLEQQHLVHRSSNISLNIQVGDAIATFLLIPALSLIHYCIRFSSIKTWCLLMLAHLSFGIFGWARTIYIWQKLFIHRSAKDCNENLARRIDEAVREIATSHILKVECKERALCCWFLLRAAGISATLVVGINLFPFAGHCWCESDSLILSDYEDHCDRFTPVLRYQ